MTTRAKVVCTKTDESIISDTMNPLDKGAYAQVESQTAYFAPAADGEENKKFFAALPSLPPLTNLRGRPFEAGKSYYLDFTEVPT